MFLSLHKQSRGKAEQSSLYIGKENFSKKVTEKFGRLKKLFYLCSRNQGQTEMYLQTISTHTLNTHTTMKTTLKNLISKGKIISVTCFKSSADCDVKLRKTSSLRGRVTAVQIYTNCRICEYENLAEVKEMRASGIEAKKPTWWHWVDYPFFAQHNNRPTEYLVLKKADIHTQYYLDGIPINKNDYEVEFLKTSHKDTLVNMVKLADVVEVKGNHKVWQKQRRLAM